AAPSQSHLPHAPPALVRSRARSPTCRRLPPRRDRGYRARLSYLRVPRIGPAVVRNQRSPTWPAGILVVSVPAQLAVQLAVFAQLVAIQPDAEPRPVRHADRTLLVRHQA